MKKFIASVNNLKSDNIYSLCLVAALLCAVQAITHVARLAILVYQQFTIRPTDTVSYFDMLEGKPVVPPGFFSILVQLLLAAVPVCLCALSFRGMSRPVRKGSLVAAGVCMMIAALLPVLMFVTAAAVADGWLPVLPAIAGAAFAAAAVLILTGRGSNAVILGLTVLFVAAIAAQKKSPIEPLYALSVALGSFAVLAASQDPKMA